MKLILGCVFTCILLYVNAGILKVNIAFQDGLAIKLHQSTETAYSIFRCLPSVCIYADGWNRHKIWGSHSCVAEDSSLVGCYTVPRRVVTDVSKGFCSRQHCIL